MATKARRFKKGQEVYWQTMFGEWFKGTITSIQRTTVTVDRTIPSGAFGIPVAKIKIA